MTSVNAIHEAYVFSRRIQVLSQHLGSHLPLDARRVLDVGCGDGRLAVLIMSQRPEVAIKGVDVLVRDQTAIPVLEFDGHHLPFDDSEFDWVMFVDVLHHADDPKQLLREATRVARSGLLIKDHTGDSALARAKLRFMDWVGNACYGVSLPYNYWRSDQWRQAIRELGLTPQTWESDLKLYPWWADWFFGWGLHFVAVLRKPAASDE